MFAHQEALAQRNRELAELHELKDRMFQNVSHELRTPLTMMLAPLQRRLEDDLPDGERRWTEELRRNGLRLLKQIDDLLDLVRLESKGMSVDPRPVEVGSLLRRVVEDANNAAQAAGVELDLEIPRARVVYRLDPLHFERIVLNLLSNALKFTPAGGSIRVMLRDDDEGLAISVADTGCGIAIEDRKKVFERFRQVDGSATRRTGGSGIGLALVSELTKLMGGTVELESRVGEGSVFSVRFPRASALSDSALDTESGVDLEGLHREADLAALAVETRTEKRLVEGTRGPRILIAEDDDDLRRQLVEIFAPAHRVVAVASGDEALREALVFRPQVVVSDVMMPGLDGVELCRRLRERFDLKDTAIVLLTAKGRLEERIEGRRAGVDSYLTKPFEVRELVASVEGLLRSRMHLVGEFLMLSRLGRGGQGDVWRAEHRGSGEQVALKVLRLKGLDDSGARRRVRREHEALTRLDHPNIVRIVAEGEEAGSFFVAMELLDGAALDEILEAGPLPAGAVAAIGAATARALAYVHQEGLLHRDVKCSNLMLVRQEKPLGERLKLIDFGTAAVVDSARLSRLVGSLPYMAPELLRGESDASPASDVYSLGVVLWRALTGALPYSGSSAEAIVAAADCGRRSGLPAAADAPAELRAAIEASLAAAEDRPSAAQVARALARMADDRIGVEMPCRAVSAAGTATVETGDEPQQRAASSGWHRT